MINVIAFGASNSKNSINKALATYAASLMKNAQVEVLDLNDFELPMFSIDRELEIGQPEQAKKFLAKLESADAIIISFAEHNGSYTVAYKNLFDWSSRIKREIFHNKPVIHLSTSPGKGGATSVLQAANNAAPFFGGNLKGSLSVPNFYENFDIEKNELKQTTIKQDLLEILDELATSIE